MITVNIIFPDQLLLKSPLPISKYKTYLVEEYLFFGQYKFHKQKIAFHRAGLKFYENFLDKKAKSIEYVDATRKESDIRKLIQHLKEDGVNEIHYIDPVDDWLEKRIEETCREKKIKTVKYDNPKFLNTTKEIEEYFRDQKKFFQTDFYVDQRKRRGLMLEAKGKPMGGKWSFDSENRKKYPAGKKAPEVQLPGNNPFWKEAVEYTEKTFQKTIENLLKNPSIPHLLKIAGPG